MPARKEERGNKLRLAGITMPYQCNIANVFPVVDFHQELLRIVRLTVYMCSRAQNKRSS